MGMIRKTASIGTLGLINFRSKAEMLERARRQGETKGFARVEAELKKLSKAEAKAAKQLARLRRKRSIRKAESLTEFLNQATPMVRDRMTSARESMHDLAVEGRKRGRKARKAARERAHQLRDALPGT